MKWLITLKLAFCLAAVVIVALTECTTSGKVSSEITEQMLLPYVGFLTYTCPFYLFRRLRRPAAWSACVAAFLAFVFTLACCNAFRRSLCGGVVLVFLAPTYLWIAMLTLFLIGLCVAWYYSRLSRRADLPTNG